MLSIVTPAKNFSDLMVVVAPRGMTGAVRAFVPTAMLTRTFEEAVRAAGVDAAGKTPMRTTAAAPRALQPMSAKL